MNYKILKFNHRLQKQYKPGKCIKINNEFYSIFKYNTNSFEILIKENSKLFNTTNFNIIELDETGFDLSCELNEKILIVAGGIGLSAIVDFIKTYVYKANILFIYYTNIDFNLNDYFTINEMNNFHYTIWNTNILGRPINPLLQFNVPNIKIIAAGPNSLINSLKNVSENVQLNYK